MQLILHPAWRERPDGDIEVFVRGKRALCQRSADGQAFLFDHDRLVDGVAAGIVTEPYGDSEGTFAFFQIGPLHFTVEDREPSRDLYRCVLTGPRPAALIFLPRGN